MWFIHIIIKGSFYNFTNFTAFYFKDNSYSFEIIFHSIKHIILWLFLEHNKYIALQTTKNLHMNYTKHYLC